MDVEFGPPKEECYFLIKGEECPNKRIPLTNFCPEHKAFFASLDNPALIELAARTWVKLLYVNDDKKLTGRVDMPVIGDLNNCLNELADRGYSDDDVSDAMASITTEKGMLDDINKQMGRDPKWKKFEKLIAGIHMLTSQGAEVKFDDHIPDRVTGEDRQIDVSIRFKHGLYPYLAIVECKDHGSRNVSMETVEAFHTKMGDVGAARGIMVSPKGFQTGAIKKAKFYNIELFTLTEIKSDWTKTIKADVFTLPFATNIELDYPDFDTSGVDRGGRRFDEMLFFRDQYSPPIPINQILGDVAKRLVADNVTLPCVVTVPCNPPLLYQFPGIKFYTPIYGFKIRYESSRFAFGREIDMPPKLVKYVYSDIAKERIHEISPKDIPKI